MSFSDLPLISDLLQTHKCKSSVTGSPCTCKFISIKKSKPAVTDRRLLNWQEWMQRRKELHRRLGENVKREPGCLVMNCSEEYRTVKERKMAMEYTKIPQPDQYRGCPGFWKMPMELKDEGVQETSCFGMLSKEDKCEIPVIEHVGLSKPIMKEKDVLPRIRNSYTSWKQLAYLKEKTKKIGEEKMKLVDPYKPQFDDLIIQGTSLHKPESMQSQHITVSEINVFTEKNVIKCDRDRSVIYLLINDLQIGPHLDITGSRKIYVVFDYDVTTGKLATEYLTIKNEGTVAIRFYWKATEQAQFFKDIIPQKDPQICFYFNKREGLIVPGQTLQFPIWFKTNVTGIYCEFWEFCTKPAVLPRNASLVIVLHASATLGDLDEKITVIRERLNNNIRDRLIKDSLSAVMSNIPHQKFKPTIYSYNKREVFETVNSKFDPLNHQPKYMYNKVVVRELQTFYKNVRRQSDPKCWNYCVEELRHLAIAKQRKEDQLKQINDQKDAEKLLAEGPKLPGLPCERTVFPNASGDIKQHVTLKEKKGNTKKSKQTKPLIEQLEEILAKLERPTVEQNFEQNKYTQAYLILCTYFNKVNEEIEDIKGRLGIIKKTKYPKLPEKYVASLYYKPPRLIYEKLDDVLKKTPLTEKVGLVTDEPAAEILQDIPVEDCKRRFKTYYNIPDSPTSDAVKGKGKKGKKQKDGKKGGQGKKPEKPQKSHASDTTKGKDKKGKGQKDKKGGQDKKNVKNLEKPQKSPDSDEDDGYVINEQFNPYAKIDLPVSKEKVEEPEEEEVDNSIQSNFDEVLPAIRHQYKYNVYVIMYNNLDKAIANIVDMIEMQPKEHVPYAVIKEIEEPNYTRRLIDLKGLLVQEKVDKLKAKLILYKYRNNSKLDWRAVEMQKQLKRTSDSSLWSILKSHEERPKVPESKPISYPKEQYEEIKKVVKKTDNASEESLIKSKIELLQNVSTCTLDGRLDPNWEDFKDVGIQKDYDKKDEHDDLVAYVEKVISEISLQELHDIKLDKATQKELDEYISDEEYFYCSESEGSSINSEPSGEGYEDYNESIEGECTSEVNA